MRASGGTEPPGSLGKEAAHGGFLIAVAKVHRVSVQASQFGVEVGVPAQHRGLKGVMGDRWIAAKELHQLSDFVLGTLHRHDAMLLHVQMVRAKLALAAFDDIEQIGAVVDVPVRVDGEPLGGGPVGLRGRCVRPGLPAVEVNLGKAVPQVEKALGFVAGNLCMQRAQGLAQIGVGPNVHEVAANALQPPRVAAVIADVARSIFVMTEQRGVAF